MDTAFKTTESSDYSVLEVWGETATGYCLLHIWRERAEFPKLKKEAIALAQIWQPQAVLIEDAASGQSLIQSLRAETRLPILPVKPLGDKVARANAVTPLVESGRVHLPESAPWLADFMDEANGFPAAPHDDQIDALSQGLSYLRRADPERVTGPDFVSPRYATVTEGGATSRQRSIPHLSHISSRSWRTNNSLRSYASCRRKNRRRMADVLCLRS